MRAQWAARAQAKHSLPQQHTHTHVIPPVEMKLRISLAQSCRTAATVYTCNPISPNEDHRQSADGNRHNKRSRASTQGVAYSRGRSYRLSVAHITIRPVPNSIWQTPIPFFFFSVSLGLPRLLSRTFFFCLSEERMRARDDAPCGD